MIIRQGHGYWRTDRYPIGGEFSRAPLGGLRVELTGKKIDFGEWNGYVEFSVPALGGNKAYRGYVDQDGIEQD